MKPKKRQKLCYNCEGEIDLEVIVCPYCAADLREEKPEQQYGAYNASSSVKSMNSHHTQTMQSLYPSPYSPKIFQQEAQEEEPSLKNTDIHESFLPKDEPSEESEKNMIGPTILFTLGAQLFLLGFMMVLFSHNGTFTLKWDARLWFLYLLASIPLLIFGYRSILKL